MSVDPTALFGNPLSDQNAIVGYPTISPNISNNSVEDFPIDTTGVFSEDVFAVDTANNEIDVLLDGQYVVVVQAEWNGDGGTDWTTGDRAEINAIQVNGATVNAPRQRKIGGGDQTIWAFHVDELDANDRIGAQVYQDSGVAQGLGGGGGGNVSRLSVIWLG